MLSVPSRLSRHPRDTFHALEDDDSPNNHIGLKMKQIAIIFSLFFTLLSPSIAHATLSNEEVELDFSYGACSDIDDPFESYNRKMFMFNSMIDHFLLRPIAKGYRKMFNEPTRDKIGNALDNTKVPLTMLNYAVQVEGEKTLLSFWQFMINSTFGALGTHDVAKARGLHVERQTLGSTLASYGFGPGPYIIIPFFKGTGMRDALDSPFANGVMNPIYPPISSDVIDSNIRLAITAGTLISDRADILPFTDHITKTSPDPYVAIRSATHQKREAEVSYPSYYKCRNIKR